MQIAAPQGHTLNAVMPVLTYPLADNALQSIHKSKLAPASKIQIIKFLSRVSDLNSNPRLYYELCDLWLQEKIQLDIETIAQLIELSDTIGEVSHISRQRILKHALQQTTKTGETDKIVLAYAYSTQLDELSLLYVLPHIQELLSTLETNPNLFELSNLDMLAQQRISSLAYDFSEYLDSFFEKSSGRLSLGNIKPSDRYKTLLYNIRKIAGDLNDSD